MIKTTGNKKFWFTLILSLVMLLLLTQCTGGETATEVPADTGSTTEEEAAPEEEAEAEEEAAPEEEASEEEAAPEEEAADEESEAADDGLFTIGMMTIATHPALDAGRDGALEALAEAGFVEGENLTVIQRDLWTKGWT
jgi:phage/plasmid primase-like uncharacterized protein